jgi:hypothetical protein
VKEHLGSTPEAQRFTDRYITMLEKHTAQSKQQLQQPPAGQAGAAGGKKGKGRKKVVDPSLLGFNVNLHGYNIVDINDEQ